MKIVQIVLVMFILYFLSYEIISFNEEFFIAIAFFSFLLFMKPVFPNFINNFYQEDRNKFFNLVNADVNYNINFFVNFITFVSLYESKKEFLYQNLNFSIYILIINFLKFYNDFSDKFENLNLEEKIPENIFNFYEKILGFLVNKLQAKYTEYFLIKWDFILLQDVITYFSFEQGGFIETMQDENWIFG